MFEMLAHEYGLGLETLSSFVDSSIDNVLLCVLFFPGSAEADVG